MTDLVLALLNRGIAVGWLILAVLLLRLPLKKAPRWASPLLWGVVGLRLCLPVSIPSPLSLIPSATTISAQSPAIQSGVPALNSVVNPALESVASAHTAQLWLTVAGAVWLLGSAAMLLYALGSYLRLRRRLRTAVRLRENIYQSEFVASPFVLGLIHPRIYLPYRMAEGTAAHVIAHERAHIRRRDQWSKLLAYLLLALYWFQPLLWVAYALFCRDVELACDARVVRDMEPAGRADYAQALLTCSAKGRRLSACPIAFSEVGVRTRIKGVLNYKKPAFWVAVLAVILCAVVAVCFLTDPLSSDAGDTGVDVSYVGVQSQWGETPTVTLYSDGTFHFMTTSLSSYYCTGSYSWEGERLTLRTSDGRYTYVFDLVGKDLAFDAAASSENTWGAELSDGAVLMRA